MTAYRQGLSLLERNKKLSNNLKILDSSPWGMEIAFLESHRISNKVSFEEDL
jgi:hypothetical protein